MRSVFVLKNCVTLLRREACESEGVFKVAIPNGGGRNMRPERKSHIQLSRRSTPPPTDPLVYEIGGLCREMSQSVCRDKCASRSSF